MTRRTPTSPWLAWCVACGLLSGITLGQVLSHRLADPWWIWGITPPVALVIAGITRRRRGSRLFAAGVMLTLGWAFGLLLHFILTVALHFMLRAITG